MKSSSIGKLFCQPKAPADEMQPIEPPSSIFGTRPSISRRVPTKFTIAVSSSLNGAPGNPAQLNTEAIGSGNLVDDARDRILVAQVDLMKGCGWHIGLVDVEPDHVRIEFAQNARGCRTHTRCRARNHNSLPGITENVVDHLCSLAFVAAERSVWGTRWAKEHTMPYAEGRTVYDADSHLMELEGWLAEYADPDVRDDLRPLYLGGAGAFVRESHRKGRVAAPTIRVSRRTSKRT